MKEWPCIGDDPWSPKAQSSLAIRARHSRSIPRVGCMCLLAVAVPQHLGWRHEVFPRLAVIQLWYGGQTELIHWHQQVREREFQNGSHQHQQEQGKIKLQKWLLPAPFFLERAPTDSCLTGRYFEISESSSPLVYMLSNCCFFSGFQGK